MTGFRNPELTLAIVPNANGKYDINVGIEHATLSDIDTEREASDIAVRILRVLRDQGGTIGFNIRRKDQDETRRILDEAIDEALSVIAPDADSDFLQWAERWAKTDLRESVRGQLLYQVDSNQAIGPSVSGFFREIGIAYGGWASWSKIGHAGQRQIGQFVQVAHEYAKSRLRP